MQLLSLDSLNLKPWPFTPSMLAGSGCSSESVEHATARSSGSISPSNSFVLVPELMSEPPVLKMQFDQTAGEQQRLQHASLVSQRQLGGLPRQCHQACAFPVA